MTRIGLHGFVSGHVQGVSFRAFVFTQASRYGVSGWARNLPDGRVEVLLCGTEDAVRTVAAALHQGPPLARVTDVALSAVQPSADRDFTIR